jgi:hypothetical protein
VAKAVKPAKPIAEVAAAEARLNCWDYPTSSFRMVPARGIGDRAVTEVNHPRALRPRVGMKLRSNHSSMPFLGVQREHRPIRHLQHYCTTMGLWRGEHDATP